MIDDSQQAVSDPSIKETTAPHLDKGAEKLDLEIRKLQLETQSLSRQLSRLGFTLEWLKSAGVLVALIGVGVSLYIGFRQARQVEQDRLNERFDRALTRLASDKVNERITAVSGLGLFLTEHNKSLQGPALHFLVNAVSLESDPLVQSAILDIFKQLKPSQISEAAVNEALVTAVERNRSLATSIRQGWDDRIAQEQKTKLAGYGRLKVQLQQMSTPIPQALISKLTLKEYLEFLEANRGLFVGLEIKEQIRLEGLARLIPTLLELGANYKDFSQIYCGECDFTRVSDLSGAKFDQAYLNRADFSRLNLRDTSFVGAQLGGTNFFAADLSNANLRNNTSGWHGGYSNAFPLFECAILRGADLSGTPLMLYVRDFNTTWEGEQALELIVPAMLSTQIDGSTKLEGFSVIAITTVSDAYLSKYPTRSQFASLRNERDDLVEDPVIEGQSITAEYRRFKADFAVNESEYTTTTLVQRTMITNKNVARIREQTKAELRGGLDQPSLTSVPLLSEFTAKIGQLQNPRWKEKKSTRCDDNKLPKSFDLTISTGKHSVRYRAEDDE